MSLSGRRTYSFTEISPFYEPGLDPNPLSAAPLSQTPMITANGSSKRLTQRDLRISSPRRSPYPSPPRTKTVTTTSRSHVTFRSPARSPIPDKSQPRSGGTRTGNQHHRSSSSKQQQPEPQPPEENLSEGKSDLIQKPDGEAGRPGRGGYNLEKVLDWKEPDLKAFKKYVKGLIDKHLDSSLSFSSQSPESLMRVRIMAADRFAFLLNYENCWPVSDVIRQQLKYTSGRARLQAIKYDAENSRMRRRARF